jgi:FKBP-type peptidyl-prolyl cis-trans isomerase FkpA
MFAVRRRHRACLLAALLTPLGTLSACVSAPEGPTKFAPFSQTDLRIGTGATVAAGQTISVHYTGWFYDESRPDQKGAAFETSLGSQPVRFQLGTTQVIFGWNQGIPGMLVGGLRRLVIPPSVGYAGFRTGPVPPWTTLIFEVEVVSIDDLSITTASLPNGTVGTPYSTQLEGQNVDIWLVTTGTLPGGLVLSSTGLLSGTPTAAGSFTFTITGQDSATGSALLPVSKQFTITITN